MRRRKRYNLVPAPRVYVRDEHYCCGFAVCWSALTHYGLSTSGLWEDLKIEPQEGTYPIDLYRVLSSRGLGLHPMPAPPPPAEVKRAMGLNEPIILMMRCGSREDSVLHWVMVTGYSAGYYRLVDSRKHMAGLVWRRIPSSQVLMAFRVSRLPGVSRWGFRRFAANPYRRAAKWSSA